MEFDLSNLHVSEPIVPDIPKLTKTEIAKKIVTWTVGGAVSGVVVTLIHANTPTYNKTQKVKLYIGAYVIGAMVADKAVDWTADQFDSIVSAFKRHNEPEIIEDEELKTLFEAAPETTKVTPEQ